MMTQVSKASRSSRGTSYKDMGQKKSHNGGSSSYKNMSSSASNQGEYCVISDLVSDITH